MPKVRFEVKQKDAQYVKRDATTTKQEPAGRDSNPRFHRRFRPNDFASKNGNRNTTMNKPDVMQSNYASWQAFIVSRADNMVLRILNL